MQRFEQYIVDSAGSYGVAVDRTEEMLDTDGRETHEGQDGHEGHEGRDEHIHDTFTDDPVRVYLRAMGSVRLLDRQGEVTLARRMERGKFRMLEALSRSPLVRRNALGILENARNESVRLDD